VEIPEGCVGLIWPPVFYNTVQQNLLQFPSTVPTGEIMVCLLNTSPRNGRSRSTDDQEVILTEGETFHKNAALINKKDRIAQLLIQEIRTTTLIEVDSLLDNPKQLDE
jgi:dUTPase